MDLRAAIAAWVTCIEKSNVLLAQCQAAPMSECDLGELSKLIEIDLGFNSLTRLRHLDPEIINRKLCRMPSQPAKQQSDLQGEYQRICPISFGVPA